MEDELSQNQKSLSIAVMVMAVVILTWLTVGAAIDGAKNVEVASAFGRLLGRLTGQFIFTAMTALAVLGLVQRRWDTWRSPYFLPALVGVPLVAGVAVIALAQFRIAPDSTTAALHQTFDGYEAKFADQSRALQDSLYALGYPEFLHPASLGAPGGLKRAQTKIQKARDILTAAHEQEYATIAEIRGKIAALPTNQANKDRTIAGFNAGLNASFADGERLWMALDSAMAEQQKMLDFLAQTKGRWKTDGDKLLFYRASDLETYRRLQQSAQQFADKAAAAAKRIKEHRRQPQTP